MNDSKIQQITQLFAAIFTTKKKQQKTYAVVSIHNLKQLAPYQSPLRRQNVRFRLSRILGQKFGGIKL